MDVESRILKQDTSTVGAYNIVPLAGIVGEFSGWIRLMEWLWDISNFILSAEVPNKGESASSTSSSGAQLIDRLRTETQTGYSDVEETARHLSKVGETAWLRQLSTWLLYGRLPSFGASDFFIQGEEMEDSNAPIFKLHHEQLPKIVTRQTAYSVLFIGKSLNQIRTLPPTIKAANALSNASELELLPQHADLLAKVHTPVAAAELSRAVTGIRSSLLRNLLQHLLPREKIVELLNVLHQFFLGGRGEFAMALVADADEKMSKKYQGPYSTKATNSVKGLLLKEAEINQILTRSLSILSNLSDNDEQTDDVLDLASRLLHLRSRNSQGHRPGTPGRAKDTDSILPKIAELSFDELLLSVPCSLTLDIESPLDLFITRADLDVYSSIHSYLLGVRRAHLHLSQLWRHSSIRREHPSPPGYQYSNSAHGKEILRRRRQRAGTRTRFMRTIWATCAAAVFFLAESEAYFQGNVVQESFHHFLTWINGAGDASPHDGLPAPVHFSSTSEYHNPTIEKDATKQHDPEALAFAHRQFLASISYSLLLTDISFTKALRSFCTHVDELVAYIARLTYIQQNLDLEDDEGVEDFSQHHRKEEQEVSLELDRARRRLDSDLKGLIERLREIDHERIGASAPSLVNGSASRDDTFEPLRVGGIDRLLMKLDWSDEDEDKETEDLI